MRKVREATRDERGATVIEYGLICACIIIAMMVSLSLFAGAATNMLNNVSDQVVHAS